MPSHMALLPVKGGLERPISRLLKSSFLPVYFPSTSVDALLRLLQTALTICLQFLVARFASMFSLVLMQFLQARPRRSIQFPVSFCFTWTTRVGSLNRSGNSYKFSV